MLDKLLKMGSLLLLLGLASQLRIPDDSCYDVVHSGPGHEEAGNEPDGLVDVEDGGHMGNPAEIERDFNILQLRFEAVVELFEKLFAQDEVLNVIQEYVDPGQLLKELLFSFDVSVDAPDPSLQRSMVAL